MRVLEYQSLPKLAELRLGARLDGPQSAHLRAATPTGTRGIMEAAPTLASDWLQFALWPLID